MTCDKHVVTVVKNVYIKKEDEWVNIGPCFVCKQCNSIVNEK